jgi:isoprenylcysteine carboxyl methyltransferase (ICMT) family protein YpbQ
MKLVGPRQVATAAVAVVAVQRLGELAWSKRNERRLRARGAVEYGRSHYPAMVALHAGWLASMIIETPADRCRTEGGAWARARRVRGGPAAALLGDCLVG